VASCSHLDTIEILEVPPSIPGCEDCPRIGGRWVHLRMCQQCGHIGCCDNSPNRHATAHHHETGHPIIRSAEPGEDWSWCYVDELMFRLGRQ
jgi:ubiquitin-hydrolase Zn-finger-containing protein